MNRRIVVSVAVLLALITGADAQKYTGVVDKTVAVIGNSMISLSQVEAEALSASFDGYSSDWNLRCNVLENIMFHKIFYTQAKIDSLNVNMDMVNAQLEEQINNIVSRLGGEEEAERYFGKPLHKLRQEYKERITEIALSQEMQRKVATSVTEMTPKEVKEIYLSTPKDSIPTIAIQYRYSQILLYPDRERANMEVKERLLELRERVLNGEKFSVLATLYSEDPASAMKGGELGMTSKSLFWPAFGEAAMSLKEGQVSAIVETPDGYHLIQMIERRGDMFNARHILLKPRYTDEDRNNAFIRLDSIITAVNADSISFEDAARRFSEDPQSRTNGGMVSDPGSGSTLFVVDQLKPADYALLKDLKPGQISKPFESLDNEGRNGNTVYKVVRLEEVVPAHKATFEKDFDVLLNIAKNKQAYAAIEKFVKEKQKTTYIVIDPLFVKCKFQREGWVR